MIRVVVILVSLVFAMSASAETLTLSDTYKATGTNPDGSPYTGTVSIKILSDTTFAIKWTIDGTVYEGFGMRRNDALAATYTIEGEPGLVVYKVDGNGLDGLWSIRGHSGSGTEHLTPNP